MTKINQVQRAYNAWPILIDCAAQRKTITYSDLTNKLNLHWRAASHLLGVIQSYCLSERLPPLTILAVSSTTGEPGEGFIAWDVDDLQAGLEQVYDFNWSNIQNPFVYAANGLTEDDLVDELVSHPETAGEVFSRVKVRGVAQVLFRKALLRVYDYQCAFCGLTFEDALEASHIIPWAKASAQQRLDPKKWHPALLSSPQSI
jgi:putative restriction endonuclease